jgi:drug/metabolite transporter (DMT)-like permease
MRAGALNRMDRSTSSKETGPWVAGALAALVLIWGTTWAAIRIGLLGVPPFTGAAARFAVSAALLLAAHRLFRVRLDTRPVARRLWLVNGILIFFVSYGTVYVSEQSLPSGLAAILFATYPLLVAVLAHFLLPGERGSVATWLGVALGLAGVVVIDSEDLAVLAGPRARIAATCFLLSPLSTALANVLAKRWSDDVHPLTQTTVPMAIGATCLGAGAALLERDLPVHWDARSVLCVGYLALFGSALTFGLYFWLLRRLAATRLALVAYGTPVVAVIVGAAFLGEPLTIREGVGALTVLAGVATAGSAKG